MWDSQPATFTIKEVPSEITLVLEPKKH